MYNRYIRNDQGVYTRVSEEEPGSRSTEGPASRASSSEPGSAPPSGPPQGHGASAEGPSESFSGPPPRPSLTFGQPFFGGSPQHDGLSSTLRRLLDKFHLEHVDSGDLLLLLLLFFLFKEDADEELLIALGLLLIL